MTTRAGVSYASARRYSPEELTDDSTHTEQIEASVERGRAEEEVEENPAPPLRVIEDRKSERGLAWLDVECDELDRIPLADMAQFIDHRNAGRGDEVPEFLLTALQDVEGPIECLVKVRYPANVKEGEKLVFKHRDMQIKVKAKGNRGGKNAILAVYVKQKGMERSDVSGLSAFTATTAKRLSNSFKQRKELPEPPPATPRMEQIEASLEEERAEEGEGSPIPPRLRVIEDKNPERGLAWVDVECDELDRIPLADMAQFIDHRNAGRGDEVPEFLLTALQDVEGPIECLVKVRYPANVKEGEKLVFKHRDMQIKVKAKGNRGGKNAILAVYVKQKGKERSDVSGLSALTARLTGSPKTRKEVPDSPPATSHIEPIAASVEVEGSPIPPHLRVIEDNNAERGLAWVDVDCNLSDRIPVADMAQFIDRRNAGRADEVPEFLLTALQDVDGPIECLVKVRYPANVKEGEKLVFKHRDMQIKVKAKGNRGGKNAILAVYAKNKSGQSASTARFSGAPKPKKDQPEQPAATLRMEQIEASVEGDRAGDGEENRIPPHLRVIEDKKSERGLAWVDVECSVLDTIPLADMAQFIDHRNAGRADEVPEFLLTALQDVEGPIECLVKVRYPANVKEGEKLVFKHRDMQIKVKAKGNRGGKNAILAVYVKQKGMERSERRSGSDKNRKFPSMFKHEQRPEPIHGL